MDNEDKLERLNPIVRENLREIVTSLSEYANDDKSGIPERLKKLHDAGFIAGVSFLVKLGRLNGPEPAKTHEQKLLTRGSAAEGPSRADLKAADEMGISLTEVVAIEEQADATAYEAVLRDLREIAPKLSRRMRDWVCKYVAYTFPQLNVVVPGAEHLADDKRWITKLGDMISKMLTLPDPQKELETLLSHIEKHRNE